MTTRTSLGTLRIGKDGEVRLPEEVREYLGVAEGDTLQVTVDETGEVGVRKLTWDEAVEQLREAVGDAFNEVDVQAYVRSLRNEWED